MMNDLRFGDLLLPADRPFVIAEAGVNHENSLDAALQMVDAAAAAGADAIKFQSYKAETLASRHSPAYWDLNEEPTRSQFDLFKKHDRFGDAEYEALAGHARARGIHFMSTPFDRHFADLLEPLMPAYKIASADLTNLPFLRQCAAKGKPMILSVGASEDSEIDEALRAVKETGNSQVALLHCVLSYPTRPEDAHLGAIGYLTRRYPHIVIGYSDHVPPGPSMLAPFSAWLLGARIIEKHFTLDKTLPGNDHYHAMDPDDLRRFRRMCEDAAVMIGGDERRVWPCEQDARRQARRSLVAATTIRKGEPATEQTIAIKRPGTGIPPASLTALLGRRALRDIDADEILAWDMFAEPSRSETR
jgi:N-acetylneuraminate synthase